MLFRPYFPKYPLSESIQMLWYVEGTLPYDREKILPTGTVELIINLGAPYRIIDKSNPGKYSDSKYIWVAGFQTEYLINHATDRRVNTIGVSFRAGGAYPFFNFPISELNDQVIEMDLVWGRQAGEIRSRILEADSIQKKFLVLEETLLQRLNPQRFGIEMVKYAAQKLQRSERIPSIKGLSEEIGISQKHLISQFKRLVGVSPKMLARIYRFQQALGQIDPNAPPNWAEIALNSGYYDQAHFNKDFQAFSGLNPSTYLELRDGFLGEEAFAGNANFVPVGE